MNKRIQELAEQAGYEKDMFGLGHWDMPEFQKFTELLVQKCASLARNADLEDVEGGDSAMLRAAAEQIEKYFACKG